MRKKILAIILARGGSKGIKDKNIKTVAGLPLIAWTIKAGLNSKYIDKVIVSTDSKKIAEISKIHGASVPFLRPKNLASDESKSEDALTHALEEIQKEKEYEFFVLLQPTSPLRTKKHLDEAIKKFIEHDSSDTLISVKKLEKHPNLIRKINKNGFLEKFIQSDDQTIRRQDMEKLFVPNGAIYIAKVGNYLATKNLYQNSIYYEMDKISSIDIDDETDLKIAQFFLQN